MFINKVLGEDMDTAIKLPMTHDELAKYASKYESREWFEKKPAFQACMNCYKITERVVKIENVNFCADCFKTFQPEGNYD